MAGGGGGRGGTGREIPAEASATGASRAERPNERGSLVGALLDALIFSSPRPCTMERAPRWHPLCTRNHDRTLLLPTPFAYLLYHHFFYTRFSPRIILLVSPFRLVKLWFRSGFGHFFFRQFLAILFYVLVERHVHYFLRAAGLRAMTHK